MNACLLALGIALGCTADPSPADPWLGEDKLRHFTVSAAATTMGYGAARFALDPEPAALTAAAVGLGLGLAKEVVDRRRGGRFSTRDLVWDAAGVALAFTLAKRIR